MSNRRGEMVKEMNKHDILFLSACRLEDNEVSYLDNSEGHFHRLGKDASETLHENKPSLESQVLPRRRLGQWIRNLLLPTFTSVYECQTPRGHLCDVVINSLVAFTYARLSILKGEPALFHDLDDCKKRSETVDLSHQH